MIKNSLRLNKKLLGDNAESFSINHSWKQDNQAWWDWYVTLADNKDEYDENKLIQIPSLPKVSMQSIKDIHGELSTPYKLTKKQRKSFLTDGFVKIPNVLSTNAVLVLRRELLKLLRKSFDLTPNGTRNNRFLSLEMMWLKNSLIRKYVLSSRIAKICADLLGVKSVRLYHDNALAKEPGCGRTPWHYDDHHFPLATHDVVTAWIPAQPIPIEMGPLTFAKPISVHKLVENINFNKFDTSYDKQIAEIFRLNKVCIDEGAFKMGEVSFHHNLSFHTAARNRTKMTRVVLANTFFADGARVVDQPTMVSGDWQKFLPGVEPGGIAASKFNPICWQKDK